MTEGFIALVFLLLFDKSSHKSSYVALTSINSSQAMIHNA